MPTIEIDGARLCVIDGGPRTARAVVLLHGFPLSSAMWRDQVACLADRYRVVAPDLRGFGGSSLGDWPGHGAPSLDRYTDDAVALIDRLGIARPVTVVGFSMGGYVALNLLRRHPTRCDSLVLMDTRAQADDDTQRATRLKMAEGVGEWGSARVAELMRPKLFGSGASRQTIDETVAVIAATDPAAIAAAQRAMAARPDSTPWLATISIPTLVLVGADDAISTAGEMKTIAEAIPSARFVVVPDAGHMAPVERPDEVSRALLEFLGQRGPA